MLRLEFCEWIDAHARILEMSVSESVMHSQLFFKIDAPAWVLWQNRCSRSHSGDDGCRICDAFSNFSPKSMLPLQLCDRIYAHARILERSVPESVMHSQFFFKIDAPAWVLWQSRCPRSHSGEVGYRIYDAFQSFCKNLCSRLSFVSESMLTLAF